LKNTYPNSDQILKNQPLYPGDMEMKNIPDMKIHEY